jgi:hypothetical protein
VDSFSHAGQIRRQIGGEAVTAVMRKTVSQSRQ